MSPSGVLYWIAGLGKLTTEDGREIVFTSTGLDKDGGGTGKPWRVELEATGEVLSDHQRPDKAWQRAVEEAEKRGEPVVVVGAHRVTVP